jgi:hypothetical protein
MPGTHGIAGGPTATTLATARGRVRGALARDGQPESLAVDGRRARHAIEPYGTLLTALAQGRGGAKGAHMTDAEWVASILG